MFSNTAFHLSWEVAALQVRSAFSVSLKSYDISSFQTWKKGLLRASLLLEDGGRTRHLLPPPERAEGYAPFCRAGKMWGQPWGWWLLTRGWQSITVFQLSGQHPCGGRPWSLNQRHGGLCAEPHVLGEATGLAPTEPPLADPGPGRGGRRSPAGCPRSRAFWPGWCFPGR